MEWRNLYRGLIMGVSDLVPGVSGGTIAVLLGIYDRLLEAISGFFSKEWRRHIGFLLPLAAGMGAALLLLSRVINYFLEHHFVPTQYFFLGLVIGVLPFIINQADAKKHFSSRHFVILIAAAAVVASMAFIDTGQSAEPITTLTFPAVAGLFFSGWLASMAMLLPGISGSFVLLLLGVHSTAIHALSELIFPLIAVIGAGIIVGFIVSSKGISYLLANYRHMTYAVIIGLIIGSVFVVFPGFADDFSSLAVCLITFVAGFGLTMLLGSGHE